MLIIAFKQLKKWPVATLILIGTITILRNAKIGDFLTPLPPNVTKCNALDPNNQLSDAFILEIGAITDVFLPLPQLISSLPSSVPSVKDSKKFLRRAKGAAQ